MHARSIFLAGLNKIVTGKPRILVIHSSLARLIPPEDFKSWDALYAVKAFVDEGWTVSLPSFTFSFCKTGYYHWKHTSSETGIFADWLLNSFPEAIRSPHPIYSFVLFGNKAKDISACLNSTTFGDDSPFCLFEKLNARIAMIGCGWDACTQLHRYEELSKVKYRYYKEFKGRADYGQGETEVSAEMYVRDPEVNPVNDMNLIAPKLEQCQSFASTDMFRGRAIAIDTSDLAKATLEELSKDPFALIENKNAVNYSLNRLNEAKSQPPYRVCILGNANLHRLEHLLSEKLKKVMPERYVQFFKIPFGQLIPESMNTGSGLNRFKPQVRIYVDRIEDLGSIDDKKTLNEAATNYAKQIAYLHKRHGGWSIVHRLSIINPTNNNEELKENQETVSMLNKIIENELKGLNQVLWVDVAAEAANHKSAACDNRLWHLGRFPFSESFGSRLANTWATMILAILGKSARLVVVDLDNTLWGGVLGEDGVEGLAIGGDYPGNAYLEFQNELKKLKKRGIALAIASKNDQDLALETIDALHAMAIQSEDITSHRINWLPKWQNIIEIAGELNLGLSSVLFIDDNPVERAQVRQQLPDVKIIDLPDDPANYTSALRKCPYLGSVLITDEDRKRLQSFKALKEFRSGAANAKDYNDYLKTLDMKLYFQPLSKENSQRAVQLCQKTNQFNTTTRRYTLEDLQKLAIDGADVVVIGLKDRFLPFENIGLIILKEDGPFTGIIDLYLLSCRVLGRGLEIGVVLWALEHSKKRGWTSLKGQIIKTERNTPARSVFQDSGFQMESEDVWTAQTANSAPLPSYFELRNLINNDSNMEA